ncbi:MAG: hypothetical protein H6618_08825 [Deltaproteobacteria bacterium]|nr:hypothetical protein [Deltaproteobacteria bacterium]
MVDYGQKKEFIQKIENVDHYPDIAGIKLSAIPPILAFSLIPLWIGYLGISTVLLIVLFGFAYWAAKKEDEGRPVILNAHLVRAKQKLPIAAQKFLVPSIAAIIPHQSNYRR